MGEVLRRLEVSVPLAAFGLGLVFWGAGLGLVALWLFVVGAVALALLLPLEYAVLSPLFAGIVGWLVDMLPFVMLAGWGVVILRWAFGLVREKRLPRGGRWLLLPIALIVWTALGVLVIEGSDFKHFLLLLGIQVLASGIVMLIVDLARDLERRVLIASGLVSFVVVLSGGVLLEWVGVPIQELQDDTVSRRAEVAYGVDAFPNNVGMIKYTWAKNSGAGELGAELKKARSKQPAMPDYDVFRPKFGAFDGYLVVRFFGSARPVEGDLKPHDIELIYDTVGITPANTVPRLRSFPRNALTYAGICAAIFPVAFFLAWSGVGRRKLLGRLGIAACLFGAGLSLVRGAWAAIGLGIVYLLIDGLLTKRRKVQVVATFLAAALALTGLFYVKYNVDPLTARAGAEGSVEEREDVYLETIESLKSIYLVLGFGTEKPRSDSGLSHSLGAYIPRAGTHSTYLNYLFRTGIPGGLLIIILYAVAGLHIRAAARAKRGEERTFNTLLAAAVLIAAAHGAVLSLFVEPIYTLCISIIIGLAMAGAIGMGRSIWPWHRAPAAT
jgi:O-Antigen ligase